TGRRPDCGIQLSQWCDNGRVTRPGCRRIKIMNLPAIIEIHQESLLEHPAMQAWSRLQLHQVAPAHIESLKHKHKSAIYRLAGIGPEGTNVIAKRSLAAAAKTERLIYEKILPQLPMPTLHCFGS